MTHTLARAVSLLGHPLLVLPPAMLAMLAARGSGGEALHGIAAGFLGFGALVVAYTHWQVRRGRWVHVDASGPQERRTLNRFLLAAPTVATVAAALAGAAPALWLALGLSAAMIAMAMAVARRCTLSLHMAFAVFSAWLAGHAGWPWLLAAAAFTALVAWSRLALRRHTPRDLLAGTAAGLLAGLAHGSLLRAWEG